MRAIPSGSQPKKPMRGLVKTSRYFNLLFIPEDHRRVRKFRFSLWNIRLLMGLALVAVCFLSFNFGGFLYYRSLYRSFEKERGSNLQFTKERAAIMENLKNLEAVVSSTEKFANDLASLVGTERPSLRAGIGPVQKSSFDVPIRTEPVITWEELGEKTDLIEDRAESIQMRIKELMKIQEEKLVYQASRPSIWPVKGWVTSEFGNRRSPFNRSRDFHAGIDIAAQWGTAVVAPAAGVVSYSGYKGGLGRTVIVDHGYGIHSYFGHAAALLVRQGQKVKRGTQIARVGNSGHSTGPHLHYEIHVDGVATDPMTYILQ